MQTTVSACIDALIAHKVVTRDELMPCSEQDIETISAAAGGPLPHHYVTFLRRMGRGAGHFMSGSSFFYPKLLELRGSVMELIAENPGDLVLPNDAVVICFHQGYEYEFFTRSDGEDPPIYQCFETHKGIAHQWRNFEEFFCDLVRQHVG